MATDKEFDAALEAASRQISIQKGIDPDERWCDESAHIEDDIEAAPYWTLEAKSLGPAIRAALDAAALARQADDLALFTAGFCAENCADEKSEAAK